MKQFTTMASVLNYLFNWGINKGTTLTLYNERIVNADTIKAI